MEKAIENNGEHIEYKALIQGYRNEKLKANPIKACLVHVLVIVHCVYLVGKNLCPHLVHGKTTCSYVWDTNIPARLLADLGLPRKVVVHVDPGGV